jgi:hypothetical protein
MHATGAVNEEPERRGASALRSGALDRPLHEEKSENQLARAGYRDSTPLGFRLEPRVFRPV